MADLFTVWAKTGEGQIAPFLVPRDTAGLTVGRSIPKMGVRASVTSEVFFDACRIPGRYLLAAPDQGRAVLEEIVRLDRVGRGPGRSGRPGRPVAGGGSVAAVQRGLVRFRLPLRTLHGPPRSGQQRLDIFATIMEKARQYNIDPARLHIDPLVEMLCTAEDGINVILDVIRQIKQAYPTIHVTGGASNISFGMPLRPIINRYFMALAIQAGLDSAIINPNDRELKAAIMTAEMLMDRDKYCLNFNKAFRAGKIGPKPE